MIVPSHLYTGSGSDRLRLRNPGRLFPFFDDVGLLPYGAATVDANRLDAAILVLLHLTYYKKLVLLRNNRYRDNANTSVKDDN